jgi:hypothetical protein
MITLRTTRNPCHHATTPVNWYQNHPQQAIPLEVRFYYPLAKTLATRRKTNQVTSPISQQSTLPKVKSLKLQRSQPRFNVSSRTSPCLKQKFKSVPLKLGEGQSCVVKLLRGLLIELIRQTLYEPSSSRYIRRTSATIS